jgi:GMP synthase-like glutamine amidotransferase
MFAFGRFVFFVSSWCLRPNRLRAMIGRMKDMSTPTTDLTPGAPAARPLVVNAMLDPALADDFDRCLDRICRAAGVTPMLRRVHDLRSNEDPGPYTHLILSGSEASAMEDRPWTGPLEAVTRRTVDAGKPVLGICYGHQFLVRVLLGRAHVRRASVPEFGWIRPRVGPAGQRDPLLAGTDGQPVMVSHFDEVFDLTPDFCVLAHSPDCAVHAFRYRALPVWGVQFHPEYGPAEAEAIFRALVAEFPDLAGCIREERDSSAPFTPNDRIFRNFLDICPPVRTTGGLQVEP